MFRIHLVLIVALASFAGSGPVAAQSQPVQVRIATGTFMYDQDESLLEVYISLGAKSLAYLPTEDGSYLAKVPIRIRVQSASASAPNAPRPEPIRNELLDLNFQVGNPAGLAEGQVFVEQVRMAVPAGEYEVIATLYGPEGGDWQEFEVVSDVTVPAYATAPETSISDIQLASSIQRADSTSARFVKNGIEIVPNPDGFYGGELRNVPFYAEVYRPNGGSNPYTLLSYVAETNQPNPLPGTQRRRTRDPRPVDVVVDNVDISALPSGVYFLRLVALNDANESIAEQSRRFFVINPDVERPRAAAIELDHEEMLFAVMGEEELEANVEHTEILANTREQEWKARLATDEERREYLTAFWRNRRTDSNPNANDARRIFYERLNSANDRFAQGGVDGYKTDRGRVFVKYGPPSEIDRKTVNMGAPPYEVWYYDNIPGEGRAQFVFADRFRIGRLELIHSDVTGEVSQPDWQNTLSGR